MILLLLLGGRVRVRLDLIVDWVGLCCLLFGFGSCLVSLTGT